MDRDHPSAAFEALYAVLTVVFLVGIHLDSRSHVHDAPEAFVTLEHGIFYAAAGGLALLLAVSWVRRRDRDDLGALPPGYGLAAAGLAVFALAGLGDLAWHRAFGIESDIEALVSPTHLMLAGGAFLFSSAPLRSALRRAEPPGTWTDQLPAAAGALGGLAVLAFMVQFLHPVTQAVADPGYDGAIGLAGGLAGWVVASALLTGAVLALDAALRVRLGLVTLVFVADGLLLGIPHENWVLVLPLAAAGLAAEGLLRSPLQTPRRERVLGATVGLTMGLAYFATLAATSGIAWNVHLWTGAVALATAAGALTGLAATLPSPGTGSG